MKKILIIGPAYPYRGGPALFVGNLYEKLSPNFNVEVVSFTRLYPQILFPGVRQEDISKVPAKKHPVRRMIDSVNPFTWFKTARYVLSQKPDLLVFDWYQPFFGLCYHVIARLVKKSNITILFITENVISHEARFIDSFLTKIALRYADYFLVMSESVGKFLAEFLPNRPIFESALPLFHSAETAVENWTNETAKAKLGLSGKKVILFFGYIRKYKGLRQLLSAFPNIISKLPDAHLLIVGECYENVDEYRTLISQTGAEKSITFINEYVPNEEISLYYNAADVVALPYISATQSGIVKIAFGFGKPVVATDVGGLAEEIGKWNAGFVVPPNQPEKFADAIILFFESSEREKFAQGAKKAAQANDFDKISDVFEQIFIEIDKRKAT